MCGRGGGASSIDRRELASVMVRKRYVDDSRGEGGRRIGEWGGGCGRADERTRV